MAFLHLDGSETYHAFECGINELESFMFGAMPCYVLESISEHLAESGDDVPLHALMDLDLYKFALLLKPSEMKIVVVVTRFDTCNFTAALKLESEGCIVLATDLTGHHFGMME